MRSSFGGRIMTHLYLKIAVQENLF